MHILGTLRASFNWRLLTPVILCLAVALGSFAPPLAMQSAALNAPPGASGPDGASNPASQAPGSTILVPADGPCYPELLEPSGEASGYADEVLMSVRDVKTNKYWDHQKKWVRQEKWLGTVVVPPGDTGEKSTWSTVKVAQWELGTRYAVRPRAKVQEQVEIPGDGHTFLYDACCYAYLPLLLGNPPRPAPTWHQGEDIPDDATVYSMAACPTKVDMVYAATEEGVYRSGDGGKTWPDKWLTNMTCYSVALDPGDGRCQTVYVGTKVNGLRITKDGGTKWEPANGIPDNLRVFAVAVDPKNRKKVYAGTEGQGMVYQSTDLGESWTEFKDGLQSGTTIRTLAIDESDPQTIYAGTWGRNVHRRTGLDAWAPAKVPEVPYIYDLAIDRSDQKVLFAGTYQNGVYRTADRGGTWTSDRLHAKSVLTVLVKDDASVYAGADGTADGESVYLRIGDRSWKAMEEQPGVEQKLQNLKVWSLATTDSVLLAGTTKGVWWYGSR